MEAIRRKVLPRPDLMADPTIASALHDALTALEERANTLALLDKLSSENEFECVPGRPFLSDSLCPSILLSAFLPSFSSCLFMASHSTQLVFLLVCPSLPVSSDMLPLICSDPQERVFPGLRTTSSLPVI